MTIAFSLLKDEMQRGVVISSVFWVESLVPLRNTDETFSLAINSEIIGRIEAESVSSLQSGGVVSSVGGGNQYVTDHLPHLY